MRVSTPPPGRGSRPPPKPGNKGAKTAAQYLEDAELARAALDLHEALLAIELALELEPNDPAIWADKAYTLLLKDARLHGREANLLARDARRADPSLPLPYVVVGLLMEQVGEVERALQMYRAALQRDQTCQEAQDCLDRHERGK